MAKATKNQMDNRAERSFTTGRTLMSRLLFYQITVFQKRVGSVISPSWKYIHGTIPDTGEDEKASVSRGSLPAWRCQTRNNRPESCDGLDEGPDRSETKANKTALQVILCHFFTNRRFRYRSDGKGTQIFQHMILLLIFFLLIFLERTPVLVFLEMDQLHAFGIGHCTLMSDLSRRIPPSSLG